jgi:LuxR family maltose regulon positive regulatory protein
LVPRPHLIQRLEEGLQLGHRVTLVSAPAGFGKTTLLSDWLRQTDRAAAWLSLDEGDNDPTRFLAYLIAALQKVDPAIGQSAQTTLQAAHPLPMEPLLTTLINDIVATAEPFILVLDDYHVIEASAIHKAVSFLLDHMPSLDQGAHFVFATRADPPLPLARLRGRGQLTELHAADLRFSPDEAGAFLNQVMGLSLATGEIAALEKRTEGWATGLQLAALSLRGCDDVPAFISAFTGSHRYVLDYLTEEVLNRQSEDVRTFLLHTAILDRLTGPLCDAVRFGYAKSPSRSEEAADPIRIAATEQSDSQSVLEALEAANLFINPLDDERRWYRYHHLFADLLRHRLHRERPDLEPELHLRACDWYERNEWLSSALRHALASGNDERVARLVEANSMAMMDRSVSVTLLRWLEVLPQEVAQSRPWLSVAHAWVLAYDGQLDSIEAPLQDAENTLDRLEESTQKHRIMGHIAAIRMFAVFLAGELDIALELGRQALQQLPDADLRVRGFVASHMASALRWHGDLAAAARTSAEIIALSQAVGERQVAAEALCIQSGTQILQGRLRAAAASCREAMRLADDSFRQSRRSLPAIGLAHARLALVTLEWDDIDAAVSHARKGVRSAERWGTADILLVSYREMAHALQASGDSQGALDVVRQGLQVARGMSHWIYADMAAEQAKLWLAQGNLPAAQRWAAESGLHVDDQVPFHREKEYRIFARALMAQGQAARGLELLAPLADMLEALQAEYPLIAARVLQALASQQLGDSAQALAALEEALFLAEPEGYVRTFVDEGEPMARLLRGALTKGSSSRTAWRVGGTETHGITPRYVTGLLAAFGERPSTASPAAQALVEPLTERETEVLRLIASGLSNREIAHELVIAVSTVKSHINHLYGKLGAKNRTQAVAQARTLGLL